MAKYIRTHLVQHIQMENEIQKGKEIDSGRVLFTAETLVLKGKPLAPGLSLGLRGYHLCDLRPLA